MKTYYTAYDSPIGPLLLTSDGSSLTGLFMGDHKHGPSVEPSWVKQEDATPFVEAKQQIDAYFHGMLTEFNLPLSPQGTEFQQRVWNELRQIGHGTTLSYGELARRIGDPKASRAVGLANGRNPISIVIPCHRVIGANGKLTGYGGGIARKAVLLDFEQAVQARGPHTLDIKTESPSNSLFADAI